MDECMVDKEVVSYDGRTYRFVREVWHYPPPASKGGIPPELHPAVQEDLIRASIPGPKKLKHGEMKKMIEDYLSAHGPTSVSVMATALGLNNMGVVTVALKRAPDKFSIVGHEKHGASKARLWGLKQCQEGT